MNERSFVHQEYRFEEMNAYLFSDQHQDKCDYHHNNNDDEDFTKEIMHQKLPIRYSQSHDE